MPTASSHLTWESTGRGNTSTLKSFHRVREFTANRNDWPTLRDNVWTWQQIYSNASSASSKSTKFSPQRDRKSVQSPHYSCKMHLKQLLFDSNRCLQWIASDQSICQILSLNVKSMTGVLTSQTLFEAITLENSINLFYSQQERMVHVSSAFVENSDIGQSIVLLLLGLCRWNRRSMKSRNRNSFPTILSSWFKTNTCSIAAPLQSYSITIKPRDSSTEWKSRAEEIQSRSLSLEYIDEHWESNPKCCVITPFTIRISTLFLAGHS